MKNKIIYFGFFLFLQLSAFAASPLFHVVVAEKWLTAFEDYNEDEKCAFFLGTLFPDIRYLAGLSRSTTHEYGFSLEQIRAIEDPFLKGIRVHVFVDDVREKFVERQEIIKILDETKGDKILYLKFLEDEILYSAREKGASLPICHYLKQFDPAEFTFTSQEILEEWHELLRGYLSTRPSRALSKLIANGRGFSNISPELTQDSCEVMLGFRENEEAIKHVSSAIAEFDRIFSEALN
jgi:hypothetical protein